MLFTRLPEKKYLLGIDIGETFCQISYLNTRRLTAGMDPHTFSYVAGGEEFDIPAAAFQDPDSGKWCFGNDALNMSAERGKEPLTNLLTNARKGDENGDLQILIAFLGYCMSLLSKEVTFEEIEAITFTTADMDSTNAEILRKAALMQDEEQRRQSVLLVDGWSDSELVLYTLSFNKKTRPIVCFPQERHLELPADADAAEKDRLLFAAVRELMQEKEFSAAYLTGRALAGGWMKDSLNLICRGRRAFQGDTLYSKGAADSTMAACGLASKADKYFYLSRDALRCNIGMECLKKGRTVYQALLDAGAAWYDAAAQIDVLLEEGDEIVLLETSVDRGNEREIAIKLENMPQRPRAATRLRVRLSMTAADRMRLEAEDLGFGEIFPSSGMKWEQEIAIYG